MPTGRADADRPPAGDLSATGGAAHDGSDGSSSRTRIEAEGEWIGGIGENIGFGFDDAVNTVLWLLVDDGVPDRGHRTNAFDAKFKVAGCSACLPHASLRHVTVVEYASELGPRKVKLGPTKTTFSGALSADAIKVFAALPSGLEALEAEARGALARGDAVTLDYKPGRLELTMASAGETVTQTATWSVVGG